MPDFANDRPRYITDHLKELRRGLIRSLIVAAIGVGMAFWKSAFLFECLLKPFQSALSAFPALAAQVHGLQTLTPVEVFMINMKLATVVGLVLASPFILREIWVFSSPALKPNERSAIFMVFALGLFFFTAG
ncbi:MAG TPA: twin-arginine translocase subunit TatC, partial [bacterium]